MTGAVLPDHAYRPDDRSPPWSHRHALPLRQHPFQRVPAHLFPFPRIAQIARLIRAVRTTEKTSTDTVYLITSLSPRHADPARLLTLIRGHWRIESRPWLRDMTFGEDRSHLRSGSAPQIMAACRNLALTLIRRTCTDEIAAFRQHFRSRLTKALRLLVPRTRSA